MSVNLLVNEHVQEEIVTKYLNAFMCIRSLATSGGLDQ